MRHKLNVREAALHQFTQYLKMLRANLEMLQLIVLQVRHEGGKKRAGKQKRKKTQQQGT